MIYIQTNLAYKFLYQLSLSFTYRWLFLSNVDFTPYPQRLQNIIYQQWLIEHCKVAGVQHFEPAQSLRSAHSRVLVWFWVCPLRELLS